MSEYWKEKITDILGRAAGCVIACYAPSSFVVIEEAFTIKI